MKITQEDFAFHHLKKHPEQVNQNINSKVLSPKRRVQLKSSFEKALVSHGICYLKYLGHKFKLSIPGKTPISKSYIFHPVERRNLFISHFMTYLNNFRKNQRSKKERTFTKRREFIVIACTLSFLKIRSRGIRCNTRNR